MNFVPKLPGAGVFGDALAHTREPAAIVDAARGAVLDLNAAACRLWGLDPDPRLPVAIDMAMPGLVRLRQLATAGHDGHETLTFWTPRGLLARPCWYQRRQPGGHAAIFFVVWPEVLQTAGDGAAGPGPDAAGSGRPAVDAASLGKIARLIRTRHQEQGSPRTNSSRVGHGATPAPEDVPAQASDDAQARLAHELKTPLAAIVALAEIMTEGHLGPLPNERYRGYVRDIRDSARHGLTLVDGMLSHTDDAEETRNLVFSEIDLNEIGGSCASAMQPLAEKAGLALSARLTAHMPRVVADSRCIRQVLLNLLSNCVKYAGQGATVSVRTGFEAGRSAWVEVVDDGPGISREVALRVMEARGARESGPSRHNHGLGLPLSRQLATANGADLLIESTDGARVRLTFASDRIVPV